MDKIDAPDAEPYSLADAAELLDKMLHQWRKLSIRQFKGDLKDNTGRTVWSLDVTFERVDQKQKQQGDDDED